MVQVDQDLQVGGITNWARILSQKADLGSLPHQDFTVANQLSPPAQLRFHIATGYDLPQTSLAERGDFQWSRRILQILLDSLWQLQQVHELGYASPRNAFSGGDFRFGEPGVALHFLTPQAGLLVRVDTD